MKSATLSHSDALRQVLKLMTTHAEDYRPQTYAVWYEFVMQTEPELCQRLSDAIVGGGRLPRSLIDDLYQRFLIGRRQQAIDAAHSVILNALDNMATTLGDASLNADRFSGQLAGFSEGVTKARSPEVLDRCIQEIADQARESSEELARVKRRLQESEAQVKRMSEDLTQIREEVNVDALSGLSNRRRFDAALAEMIAVSVRSQSTVTLLLIDIDKFKSINDEHGHVLGDQVIRSVSQAIKGSVKGRDVPARYGGDEFAVLLPETPAQGGSTVGEYIRRIVERGRIIDFASDAAVEGLTVSIGSATWRSGETAEDLLRRADRALYKAKRSGRNRVENDG